MSMHLTFKGGVHPLHHVHEGKDFTAKHAVVQLPAPAILKIPMSQHVGAPAKPVVEVGERVLMGQMIGEANGFVSVPVHASVSGTVTAITNIPNLSGKPVRAVVIENDFQDETCFRDSLDYESMSPQEIVETIKSAGIVGMGGAAFPTHVKLSPPEGKNVNLLIVNGAECEPFLTADHRMMLEHAQKILLGTKIIMKSLGVTKALVGIEDNKPDAARVLEKHLTSVRDIRVMQLETKYPQGGEKQLIDAMTGRIVPSGGLPMDIGVVVVNVSTAAAVADMFASGEPCIRRVVTVTGAVEQPQNVMARIGTSTQEMIDFAGGFEGVPKKVISGGPMMGLIVPDMECVITKGYSGVLVLDEKYTKKEKESWCIQCGKCEDVCPIYLECSRLALAAEAEDFEKAEELSAMDCINCGCCSYECPAKIPIAQKIKFAKEMIMLNRVREKERKDREQHDMEQIKTV